MSGGVIPAYVRAAAAFCPRGCRICAPRGGLPPTGEVYAFVPCRSMPEFYNHLYLYLPPSAVRKPSSYLGVTFARRFLLFCRKKSSSEAALKAVCGAARFSSAYRRVNAASCPPRADRNRYSQGCDLAKLKKIENLP